MGGNMQHFDQRLLDGLTLLGLVGSVFGALFILYDLLGRPGGPLRWLLRIGIPTLMGGAIGAVIAAPVGILLLPQVAGGVIVFEVALIGALIGTLNGLFVGDPDLPEHQRRFTFSFVDFGLGAGVALVYLTVMEVVEWRVFGVAGISPVTDFATAAPDLLVIAFAGGVWRSVNRRRFGSVEAPPLVSLHGAAIGCAMGAAMIGAAQLASSVATVLIVVTRTPPSARATSTLVTQVLAALLVCLLVGALAGALTGAVSRFVFWWATRLPERTMQVIGVELIIVSFLAQAITPLAGLLSIPVR
jgi:hypothetical protein